MTQPGQAGHRGHLAGQHGAQARQGGEHQGLAQVQGVAHGAQAQAEIPGQREHGRQGDSDGARQYVEVDVHAGRIELRQGSGQAVADEGQEDQQRCDFQPTQSAPARFGGLGPGPDEAPDQGHRPGQQHEGPGPQGRMTAQTQAGGLARIVDMDLQPGDLHRKLPAAGQVAGAEGLRRFGPAFQPTAHRAFAAQPGDVQQAQAQGFGRALGQVQVQSVDLPAEAQVRNRATGFVGDQRLGLGQAIVDQALVLVHSLGLGLAVQDADQSGAVHQEIRDAQGGQAFQVRSVDTLKVPAEQLASGGLAEGVAQVAGGDRAAQDRSAQLGAQVVNQVTVGQRLAAEG